MHGRTRRRRWLTATLAICLFAALTTIPSAVAEEGVPGARRYLEHLSESVNVQYYVQHPTQAPKQVAPDWPNWPRRALADHGTLEPVLHEQRQQGRLQLRLLGFPQNEESVGSCPTNDSLVLGGTNDYDGIFFGDNRTGW